MTGTIYISLTLLYKSAIRDYYTLCSFLQSKYCSCKMGPKPIRTGTLVEEIATCVTIFIFHDR